MVCGGFVMGLFAIKGGTGLLDVHWFALELVLGLRWLCLCYMLMDLLELSLHILDLLLVLLSGLFLGSIWW